MKLSDDCRSIFITGAGGFLGSHLAVELARRGYSIVALVRSRNGQSGAERFRNVCRLIGTESDIVSGIPVVEGDMNLPNLGISNEQYRELNESVTDIISCAADTSFTEKRREVVERTNVHGIENLLAFAVAGNCSSFHQVSTAYVFGQTSGICKEELTSPERFTNVYEETKCRAEHISTEVCKTAGIQLNIYRPAIVCGDSKQGRTFRFNGLYYPLKSIQRIIESVRTDLQQRGGEKARRMGARMVAGNHLYLPLTLRIPENAAINIVPVDYFTRVFLRIMEDRSSGGVFHIVQRESCPVRDLIDYTKRYFNLEGLETTSGGNPDGPIERMFNLYNEAYLPYLEDKRVFSSENTQNLREFVPDDRFTYERFKICMDYAVKTDWGKSPASAG